LKEKKLLFEAIGREMEIKLPEKHYGDGGFGLKNRLHKADDFFRASESTATPTRDSKCRREERGGSISTLFCRILNDYCTKKQNNRAIRRQTHNLAELFFCGY